MKNFAPGDKVIINTDHAGMFKGDRGTVVGEVQGLITIRMHGKTKTYNILPEYLDHYTGYVR
jgi:ribosomal protein L21E